MEAHSPLSGLWCGLPLAGDHAVPISWRGVQGGCGHVRREGIRLAARRARTALTSLGPDEASRVLTELVNKHPELAAETEKLAAAAIVPPPRDQIQATVSKQLRGLEIDDLAEHAGMHQGRYVEPWTAARELIDGVVEPHLENARRLAELGRVAEAHEVAAGVLAGLYACRDLAGHDVLGYVELADRADEVVRLLARLKMPLPAEVWLDTCPAWQPGR